MRDNWGATSRATFAGKIIIQPREDAQAEQELMALQAQCEAGDATLKQFGSSHQDFCAPLTDSTIPNVSGFVWGCNCGTDACWNGTACEANP